MGVLLAGLLLLVLTLVLYGLQLNWVMRQTPAEAEPYIEPPLTPERVRRVYEAVKARRIDWHRRRPPRRERRYIIVGGSGLVGSQIALLLMRGGTPPQAIRLVDVRRPERSELSPEAGPQPAFLKADIGSEAETRAAVEAVWPRSLSSLPLTVIHTAAVIRPYERHPLLYDRCARVNVAGTAHVLAAARRAGADIFIYTSSCNAAAGGTSWLFPPCLGRPRNFVQFVGEQDWAQPLRRPADFPSNYARSKAEAERLVCRADEPAMRTGAIRPGNGIYGHQLDPVIGRILPLGRIPTFSAPWVQSFVNVNNVALAHLLLEAALLGEHADKVAGRPFAVSDKGPPVRFQDVYTIMEAASSTAFKADHPPPVLMLLLAYLVEAYSLLLVRVPWLRRLMAEPGELVGMLQPAIVSSALTTIVDDSAARRPPEEGGLGYEAACTTLEGMCSQMVDWNEWAAEKDIKVSSKLEERSNDGRRGGKK